MRYPQRGKLDTLNTAEIYESSCIYGIPEVPSYDGPLPARFLSWPNRKRAAADDGLHMFCDDTRFEPLWTSVERYRRHYEGRVICSPDFSMYVNWPPIACMYNAYRSRWSARAMAERGALVIPAVTWAGPATFDFAFAGIRRGSSVAISAYGSRRFAAAFKAGYDEMVRRIEPSRIIVVGGRVPDWMTGIYYFAANTIADS